MRIVPNSTPKELFVQMLNARSTVTLESPQIDIEAVHASGGEHNTLVGYLTHSGDRPVLLTVSYDRLNLNAYSGDPIVVVRSSLPTSFQELVEAVNDQLNERTYLYAEEFENGVGEGLDWGGYQLTPRYDSLLYTGRLQIELIQAGGG